jgi:hypothetical protein
MQKAVLEPPTFEEFLELALHMTRQRTACGAERFQEAGVVLCRAAIGEWLSSAVAMGCVEFPIGALYFLSAAVCPVSYVC